MRKRPGFAIPGPGSALIIRKEIMNAEKRSFTGAESAGIIKRVKAKEGENMRISRARVLLFSALLVLPALAWAGGQSEGSAGQKITIKIADNLPDRTNGMGLVAQTILDGYTKLHPNVSFEVESYPDQPYQEKIKLYATADQLPEVFKWWSLPTNLKPFIDSKQVRELDRSDYSDINYLPGALESNVYGGKLYGIPVTADMWFIYYNKRLFQQAGVAVPTTIDELLATIPKFKAQGIIPVVTDGKDGWPLAIIYDELIERTTGSFDTVHQALYRKASFTDPPFVAAATLFQNMVKAGLFQDDLITSDYGAARNLFGQEKAAMYIMGSWELGLVTDQNFPASFRDNIGVFKFPLIQGGPAKIDDLMAWFGGNWVASSNSKHPDIDRDLMKYLAHQWGRLTWDNQAAIPAEKIKTKPTDPPLATAILAIANSADMTSGTTTEDLSTPAFTQEFRKAVIDLVAGVSTPEQFTQQLDAAASEAAAAQ